MDKDNNTSLFTASMMSFTDNNMECDLSGDLELSYESEPRWKRKQREASNSSKNQSCDRFIPQRPQDEESYHSQQFLLHSNTGQNREDLDQSKSGKTYTSSLQDRMFNTGRRENMILAFVEKPPRPPASHRNTLRTVYSRNKNLYSKCQALSSGKSARVFPSQPDRVLDAPNLTDDFYCNPIHWGDSNIVCIALGDQVYFWNANTGEIDQLLTCKGVDEYVSSVSFSQNGDYLACATSMNVVEIWDVQTERKIRTIREYSSRVNCLSWNTYTLTSGANNGVIVNHDVRLPSPFISQLVGHEDAICGMKWSPDGTQLASGGNDNTLCIWDKNMTSITTGPLFIMKDHSGAVKALDWCPWRSKVLASGGGLTDRKLAIWNTRNGSLISERDVGNQICSLLWSKVHHELITANGYYDGSICVWAYPSLALAKQLKGHDGYRTLHLCQSPDGATICSAGADQSLRFWHFCSPVTKKEAIKDPFYNTTSMKSSTAFIR